MFLRKQTTNIAWRASRFSRLNSTKAAGNATFKQIPHSSFFLQHRTKILLSTLVGASAVVYLTNDEVSGTVKFVAHSLKRINSVTVALARCLYNYKSTLSRQYDTKEDYYSALSQCHLDSAKITLGALEHNGGIYIKLGQHISAMTYLLPKEWTETMTPLQDKCPESAYEEINAMFLKDWGQSIDEVFEEFDRKPIGVASLAQVHLAKMRGTGELVAVKCQHPSLTEFVPLDIAMTALVFNALDFVFPEYPLTWLSDEMRDSIHVELDFHNEARNSQNTKEYFERFENITALRIPKIVKTTKRILVMEYLRGERLDNLEYISQKHIDRSQVSSCLSHIFNNMIFTPGVGIHCDPHGGNLAIRSHTPTHTNPFNFEIILYDHGLYRQLTNEMRYDYAQFWLAMIDNDQAKMKQYALKFANIQESQFPLFAAAITGRDIDNALNFDIESQRSDAEIANMKSKITHEEVLVDLMSILANVPRVVLLILKTNDLTRHLDEVLQNPLGLKRTFLILSNYCADTIYKLDQRKASRLEGSWYNRWLAYLKNWWVWELRRSQLFRYDLIVYWSRLFGLEP
ncbi:hypothetical protein WICPIJ_009445 [Wickerhamomyces pijperi]|uniref:ABC1 atypical kinase-like domain-containing protein n=1 Tax=Wickerhamomyces pijperi TaxID=599730 RepID=A0A9P8PNQ3_WICPI|nr:hypothetical protein WICPIJ_009445 [Wickerhamomyces pijperi]